jgi:hypothetical protein
VASRIFLAPFLIGESISPFTLGDDVAVSNTHHQTLTVGCRVGCRIHLSPTDAGILLACYKPVLRRESFILSCDNDYMHTITNCSMHIEYILRGTLATAIGSKAEFYRTEQDITGATAGAAIRLLSDEHPALRPLVTNSKGKLRAHIALEHNGDDIRQDKWLATEISDGDRLELRSATKGGC